MALGNHTTSDFETMLRRHLEQANQFAVPCPDFDPEAANAYLEGALNGIMRSAYESHLTGCASCRHGLVMLAKMTPSVAEPALEESPVASWWRSVREAFTLPAWGVGLVAVTSALVLAFGVYALRRPATLSADGTIAMATPEVSSAPSALPAGAPGTTTMPSAGVAGQPGVRTEIHREIPGQRSKDADRAQNSLPVVAAPPALTEPIPAAKPTGQSEELKAPQSAAPASQVAAAGQSETKSREAESKKEESQRMDSLRVQQPSPSQVAETQDRSVNSSAARRLAPREAAKSKPQATPTPRSSEDENFRPLLRKVRDKSFRFDRGTWIDQEFKPENRLPRTKISRGTPDFDRVLAETPALAPFFDLGAVIVVWQGRVYEVRKW